MTSFETISLDDYKKLVDNEKKIFDLTENFSTPEILNKYRYSNKNIEDKIKQNEIKKEKYENLDKIINKSIDKLKTKPKNDFTANYNYDDDDSSITVLDKNEYDYYDIRSKIYEQNCRFNNDDDILDSFSKIFKEYDITYNPRPNTKNYQIRYFLKKLEKNDNIPKDLYNHFHAKYLKKNKSYHIIPIDKENEQTGSSINNIMINDKDLNKGKLRVRYLNNRKLTNNLLKYDYKISKNMVNAIKFNKDLHKLSKNEMKIYHELQKFLNKEQDINILIGSYLSGNNSKKLYNKISSMLYNKLKNNIISIKEYTKLINKINK